METENKNKIDKHINCVIEDYKAIKNEISRRVVFSSESPFIRQIIQAEESKEASQALLNATFLCLYLIVFPITLTVYSCIHQKQFDNFTWDIWSIIAICLAVNISQHIYLQYQNINYFRWSLLISVLLILTGLFIFFAFFLAPVLVRVPWLRPLQQGRTALRLCVRYLFIYHLL